MTTTTLLIVTIGLVACLTAAATAVRSVSRIWLRHWVERQLSGAPTAELYLERPQRLIHAATTMVALAVFVAGIVIGASSLPTANRVQIAIVFAVSLLLFGQLMPRAIARRWPNAVIPVLLPVVRLVEFLQMPLLAVVRRLTGEVRLEQRDAKAAEVDSLEELLREGELEGVGEHTEIAIIEGVVQFGERTARDVMTVRTEVFALDAALPEPQIAERVAASGYSRVPVYRDTLDRVEGMIHAFDVLQASDANGGVLLRRLRPVGSARPATPCNELLFRMLRDRRHLAVVRGEQDELLGIVTLEDLLEELVGEIRDEHDEPGTAAPRSGDAAGGAA
jgi:putative hemolysin